MKMIVIILSLMSSLANAAIEYDVPLQVEPGTLYVDQEEKMQILVKPKSVPGTKLPSKLFVIKVDENGKRIEELAVITDEGLLGDMKARDGYYSRKVKIIERKAGILRLSLARMEDSNDVFPILKEIQVVTRPSFIDVLRQVWNKIRHPSPPNTGTIDHAG